MKKLFLLSAFLCGLCASALSQTTNNPGVPIFGAGGTASGLQYVFVNGLGLLASPPNFAQANASSILTQSSATNSSGSRVSFLSDGTNWNLDYVSVFGKDSNNGKAQATAWLSLTNAFSNLSSNQFLLISPGTFYTQCSNGVLYLPIGSTVSGAGSEFTYLTNHAVAASGSDTNPSPFALADNSTLEHFTFTCDGGSEGTWITVAGTQRKLINDGYPNLSKTATNFLIRDVTVVPPLPKRQCVVLDSTNTTWGAIRDCSLQANNGYVVQVGNIDATGAQAAGEQITAPLVVNPNDGISAISGTFLLNASGSPSVPAPAAAPFLFSAGTNNWVYSGTHCIFYQNVSQPTSNYQASGCIIAGTNVVVNWATADCSFQGTAASWTNGGGNVLGTIIITGVSNTLNQFVPLPPGAIIDQGTATVINRKYASAPPTITINSAITPMVATNDLQANGNGWTMTVTNGSGSTGSAILWTNTFAVPYPIGHAPHVIGPISSAGPFMTATQKPFISGVTESNVLTAVGSSGYPTGQTNSWTYIVIP